MKIYLPCFLLFSLSALEVPAQDNLLEQKLEQFVEEGISENVASTLEKNRLAIKTAQEQLQDTLRDSKNQVNVPMHAIKIIEVALLKILPNIELLTNDLMRAKELAKQLEHVSLIPVDDQGDLHIASLEEFKEIKNLLSESLSQLKSVMGAIPLPGCQTQDVDVGLCLTSLTTDLNQPKIMDQACEEFASELNDIAQFYMPAKD
ncbi:MAG: hypothetical protein HYW48_07870 [Deltaproteobacteria bacterium]|nr:hypothetical protein [Deltaproteobacteria bacterium]